MKTDKKYFNIILYQKPLGIEIPHSDISEMKNFNPDFICFPEYFFIDRSVGHRSQTKENQKKQIERIRSLSSRLDCVVIGGTMPEIAGDKLYNTSFLFESGKFIGYYRKKNLFAPEKGRITPGEKYKTFNARGITFGVLICADVLHNNSFAFMRENNAKIIFSPTFSPRKTETVEEKFKRDKDIYVRGASISGAIIVKVCGVKSDYIDFIQARSLIADPERIIYRVTPDQEDSSMIIKKRISPDLDYNSG